MKSVTISVLLTLAFGFIISATAFAQHVEQKLTERISINFPAEVKKQENGPTSLYLIKLPDSTANFMVIVADLYKSNGLDAATITAASMEPEFWDQAETAFVAQMGAKATLKKREMKNISGYDVMKLEIDRPRDEGGVNNITAYILVDDVYSLNIIHTNRGGKADEKLKQAFFESLVIK